MNQSRSFASKLFRGGSEAIRVLAIRRDGWTGPIKVTAENLPAGVSGGETIIAANQNQTQLTLTAAEDATSGVELIRIVGRSEDGSIEQEAIAATLLWGRGGGRDFIRSTNLDRTFHFGIREGFVANHDHAWWRKRCPK